jgi:ribose transport system substrate-binding protein
MSKTLLFKMVSVLMVLTFFASACAGPAATAVPAPAQQTAPTAVSAPTTAPAPTAAPAAAAPTAASAAAAPAPTTAAASTAAPAAAAPAAAAGVPSGAVVAPADFMTPAPAGTFKVTGKFYWVQNTAWHPVHQLTQQSFLQGCADNGLQCELAISDDTSLEAWLAVAEQALARPDVKGLAMWIGGNPAAIPFVQKAVAKGVAISLPHFPIDQSFYGSAPNVVQIAADTTKWPDPVAKAMCDELKKQKVTKGSIGVTENGYNVTEDMAAKVFKEGMNKYCPDLKVLDVQLEGPEPTKAIAVAVSIIQANPDIVAGFSTTGGGPTTWAGAQKETGKKLVAIGMDYTRVNLDLVKAGQVFGIVAQPLFEENWGSAKLLAEMANGMKVPYWTILSAPLVTQANINDYYGILDRMEPKFRATAPAPTATK